MAHLKQEDGATAMPMLGPRTRPTVAASLLLAAVLCLAPCAVSAQPAEAEADPISAVLSRVGKMTLPEQQAWLKRLEQRAGRASRIALKPDEASRQQAEIHSQLHQKMVSWKALREVVAERDACEKAAIEQLVGRYRQLVVDAFATQIDATDQRQQAWRDVERDWELAGSPIEQQDRLIDWLETAIAVATPGKIGPIPDKPQFEGQPPSAATPQRPEQRAESPAAQQRSMQNTELPTIPQQPMKRIEPAATPPVPQRSTQDTKPAAVFQQRMNSIDLSAADLGRLKPQLPADATPLPRPPRREAAPSSASTPKIGKIDEKPSQEVAAVDTAKKVRPAPTPAATTGTTTETLPIAEVEIELEELAARISGCNLAFRALEMDLDEKGDWNAARLESLVDRLKILVLRRHDLELFREAVPEGQRSSLGQLPPAKRLVSQFAARIVEVRGHVSGSTFKGTESERQAELQRLDELSRRLAEAAGK